jgi:putative DNA primase/helicase
VEGCLKWQQDGLGEPKEVKEATEGYREEMDILLHFINDSCVLKTGLRVGKAALYKAYTDWCEANGEYPLKQRKFTEQLKESYQILDGRPPDKMATRAYEGIGLLADSDTSYSNNRNYVLDSRQMILLKVLSEMSERQNRTFLK